MAPSRDQLLSRVAENPSVPSPPPVAMRVLEKASQPDCTLGEIGRLIGSDAPLCSKLLQVVNSALFTRPRPVTAIDRALGLLGVKRVRSLVLSLSLPAMSKRCRGDHRLRHFWKLSVGTATVARELAVLLNRPDPESEMVAGLLCDLGILVLREVYGRAYDELLDGPPEQLARRQHTLEEEAWGFSHADVGAFLLHRWHLPDELTEAIRFHHAPTAGERLPAPLPDRIRLLHLANRTAALQLASDDPTLVRETIDLAKSTFDLGETRFREFLEPLGKKIDEVAAVLQVDAGASLDYGRILDSATEHLTRLAYETSVENLRIEEEKKLAEAERENAEEALRKSEEQLRQAQKMEAIGRLAGGVAHDFNNLLTIINGYSEMLLTMMPRETPFRGPVEQIRKAGERASALTSQLLVFSRKQVFNPIALDLNRLISNLDKMVRRLIREDIELVNVLGCGLHAIKADPGQLEQVLINLIVNARDAMPKGGKITVATTSVAVDAGSVQALAELDPGDYVLLTVSDTGCGIPPEVQARIFEPFFTTKAEGKGTGLGLAMVYGIVQQSRGHIEVESSVGRGTTFKIYLPRAGASTLAETKRKGLLPLPTGTETVLVVEDETPLRDLVRITLQRVGYTVLTAEHGPAALGASGAHDGPIHLLLTDVIMPQMNGPELAQQLTTARADTKVLYMSGYTDDVIIRQGVMQGNMPFLLKPFSPYALASKVREVLTGQASRC